MLARLAALVAHEVHARCIAPVVAEYRKLDAPPQACPYKHIEDQHVDVAGTTAANLERLPQWDHDKRPPMAGFGFTHPRKP